MVEHQLMKEGTGTVTEGWVPTMVIGGTAMTSTAKGRNPIGTAKQTTTIKHLPGTVSTNGTVGLV